jgi:hypothetical protein
MLNASSSDNILDAAQASAVLYADSFYPDVFLDEAVSQLAHTSASLYFSTTEKPEQVNDRAMYVGAFLWAYEARQSTLMEAPTSGMPRHGIDSITHSPRSA